MYQKLLTEKHEHTGEDGGPAVVWVGDAVAKEKRERERRQRKAN